MPDSDVILIGGPRDGTVIAAPDSGLVEVPIAGLTHRNFSYLDTQLKRLGSPNFTYLPVNAPKCPMAHFQQDGHMAMANPAGRVNYEPNSWDPSGPREDPAAGFRTYPGGEGDQAGPKRRLRAESFADHYSQARQFLISQTDTERHT